MGTNIVMYLEEKSFGRCYQHSYMYFVGLARLDTYILPKVHKVCIVQSTYFVP